MKNVVTWRCKGCGYALGMVQDGVLHPFVLATQIDASGTATFQCPTEECGLTKVWFPDHRVAPVRSLRSDHAAVTMRGG